MSDYHRPVERSRWRAVAELVLALVFWVVAIMVAVAVVTSAAGVDELDELDPVTNLAVSLGTIAALIPGCFAAAWITRRRPGMLSSVIGRLRWRWLARCTAIVVIVVLVAAVVTLAVEAVTGVTDEPTTRRTDAPPFAHLAVLFVIVVPLQAAGEEYLFRGTLVQAIGAFTRSRWIVIALSAAIFASLHFTELEATTVLFVMGCITAWLAIETGGLEAAIAEHAVFNLVVLLADAATGNEALGTDDMNAGVTWSGAAVQIAMLVLYAALVMRSYRKRMSAQSAAASTDQIEQHAAERRVGVEHAEHGGDTEALPPEQQQPRR